MELSPRNFGILMHKAFEEADDRQQIYEAVQRMRDDGTLSPGEAEALRGMIARALAHPVGLLRQMGYTECEGYLWYVKLGEIEKVEG